MSQFIKFCFTSSMLNMFRTFIHPEVKQNLINCDIKLVSCSSTITMMHVPIYIIYIYIYTSDYASFGVCNST